MENDLSSYLKNKFSFSESDLEKITSFFEQKEYKKGEYFLKEGQLCNKIAFLTDGAMVYFEVREGEEKICDFAFERDWVTQYKSLINQIPSEITIKTLEDTRVWLITIDELGRLFGELPQSNIIRSTLAEEYFIKSAQRSSDLANLDAEQRYNKLVREEPRLLSRVPQYYLASYLGIKPQSLSRIRTKK